MTTPEPLNRAVHRRPWEYLKFLTNSFPGHSTVRKYLFWQTYIGNPTTKKPHEWRLLCYTIESENFDIDLHGILIGLLK